MAKWKLTVDHVFLSSCKDINIIFINELKGESLYIQELNVASLMNIWQSDLGKYLVSPVMLITVRARKMLPVSAETP